MRIAGIDPDTKSITIVVLAEDEPNIVECIRVKGRRAEDRIEQLYNELFVWTGDALNDVFGPIDWVYIETPVMGVNAKALRDQAQVVGMIRYWLWSHDQPHSLVDNGTWKKGVLGNGHASKEEIAAYAQRVLRLKAGQPQDVYDAACIAEYGQRACS